MPKRHCMYVCFIVCKGNKYFWSNQVLYKKYKTFFVDTIWLSNGGQPKFETPTCF